MFDVAFSELVVIGIVALIVIGPEKLPKVARTLGLLAGRVQRYVASVKSDIEREIQFEDLKKIQEDIRQESQHAYNALNQIQSDTNKSIQEVHQSIAGGLTSNPPPATPPEVLGDKK